MGNDDGLDEGNNDGLVDGLIDTDGLLDGDFEIVGRDDSWKERRHR